MSGFKRLHFGGVTVVVALVAAQGCAAVSFQDAKMVGKGKVEFTPTVSRVGFSEEGESEAIGTGYGGMVTAGVSDKVDFIAGYERFKPSDSNGGGINLAGLGPKISVGAHAGLSVTFAGGKVVLRPEIGALKDPGESGLMWTFGLGLSLRPR